MDLSRDLPMDAVSEAAVKAVESFEPALVAWIHGSRIYVPRDGVFRQALNRLSLELHEAKACVVGNGQILGSVYIDMPAHGEYPQPHKRKLFGGYELNEEDALESAKLAALVYLQEAGIIFIDDINQSELIKLSAKLSDCQHKLLAASLWADVFQDRVASLESQLEAIRAENKDLSNATKAHGVDVAHPPSHGLALSSGQSPSHVAGPVEIAAVTSPVKERPDVMRCAKQKGTPGLLPLGGNFLNRHLLVPLS